MRKVMLFFVGILFLNMISASYSCSSGNIYTDSKAIDNKGLKNINGINIVLLSPSYGPAAEILIDVKKVVLTNTSSSQDIELLSGDYDIILKQIYGNFAEIDVEDDEEEIEPNTLIEVGGLQIYPIKISGSYPGEDANLELYAGKKFAFLYGNSPFSKETISGKEYLIEVTSSSSSQAMIRVYKCESGSLIEVADPVINNVSNNNVSIDDEDNPVIPTNNELTTPTENITDKNEGSDIQKRKSSFVKYILYFIPGLIILIILIGYLRNSKEDKEMKKEK